MSETTVRLMHYDPRWRQEFLQTRSGVLQSCSGWVTQVEHIGSTAISGLVARPTIDVLAGVHGDAEVDNGMDQAADLVEGLNYRRVTPHGWATGSVVLDKPRHGEPTHRIFLMAIGCPAWRSCHRYPGSAPRETGICDSIRGNQDCPLACRARRP